MEKILKNTLLYDFYGELLSEHQKNVYEDAVFNDLSLSEIADNYGISRQGAHDIIKRAGKTLASYEERLHMIERFKSIEKLANKAESLTRQIKTKENAEIADCIIQCTKDITEALN